MPENNKNEGTLSKLKNLIMVSPELKSFKSKVGGLGDVAEELSKDLADFGVKTTIVSLLYRRKRQEIKENGTTITKPIDIDYTGLPIEDTGKSIEVEVAGETVNVKIKKSTIGKADVILLENDEYTDLVYGGDLLKQAIFIGRATLDALRAMEIEPTIIHMHDGLAALITFLRTDKRYSDDPFLNKAKLVFTIHNAGSAYQQIFDANRFDELGIDRIHWDGIVWDGKINLTYSALFHSQRCNTVSRDYAKYIRSDGEGLGPILRKKDIFGIINGIDVDYWKIKRTKKEAKADLIRTIKSRFGANLDGNKFTIIIPRRIAYQKGLDVVLKIVKEIVKERKEGGLGAQFILLGRAHENDPLGQEWVKKFQELDKELKNKFTFINTFDQGLAKLMYEGGDLLFYPSLPDKEPCGTGYMIALVNMTPTVGTSTGGLAELIEEFDPEKQKGNGFRVIKKEYSPESFYAKLKKASILYNYHHEKWKKLVENCMKTDVSMDKIAKEYVRRLYKPTLESEI